MTPWLHLTALFKGDSRLNFEGHIETGTGRKNKRKSWENRIHLRHGKLREAVGKKNGPITGGGIPCYRPFSKKGGVI
ncbi:MAG: hypothetical protein BA864_02535 [Desulfuromonadales bacterium C00003093]|nr:MAG: hypothetical protein BA864_02535 [Desulfuromonadales bacterium C00003093]